MISINELIILIKKKKELSGLADSVIKNELLNYIKKYKISLENLKEKEQKQIIKEIRSSLRNLTGQYNTTPNLSQKKINFEELVKNHLSTKERIQTYPLIKEKISSLNPKSILDLGCGLNPLVLANQEIEYFACDINEQEINIINNYFKKNFIKGRAFVCDIRDISTKFPETDLVIAFKVLDIIEKKSHKITEHLLKTLKPKNFLISFATKKISGKKMNTPRRGWFEQICKRLNLTFEKFRSENEIFYLMSQNYSSF